MYPRWAAEFHLPCRGEPRNLPNIRGFVKFCRENCGPYLLQGFFNGVKFIYPSIVIIVILAVNTRAADIAKHLEIIQIKSISVLFNIAVPWGVTSIGAAGARHCGPRPPGLTETIKLIFINLII